MKFRSRVSILLVLIIFCAVMVPTIIPAYKDGEIIPMLLSLVVTIFVLSTLFIIRYTIEDGKLYVGSVFTRGTAYDISKLISITPTRSLLSAPASSLKRIKLDFGCGKALIISPAGQDIFIDEILRINPNVKVKI